MASDPFDPANPGVIDAHRALAELGNIRLDSTNLDGVLSRIAELAKRSVAGADEVSVTLIRERAAHTAAYTGPLALELDEWQYEKDYGPCLKAAVEQIVVSVPDTAAEDRWPEWDQRAMTAGARSSLSVGLPVQKGVAGALNVYATTSQAFDEDSVLLIQTFAGTAAVALANANLYDTTAGLAEQMRKAMDSRAVIEQAKGMIIAERRCSPDEAFAILARLSQDANRKVRDVAADMVAGGAHRRRRS